MMIFFLRISTLTVLCKSILTEFMPYFKMKYDKQTIMWIKCDWNLRHILLHSLSLTSLLRMVTPNHQLFLIYLPPSADWIIVQGSVLGATFGLILISIKVIYCSYFTLTIKQKQIDVFNFNKKIIKSEIFKLISELYYEIVTEVHHRVIVCHTTGHCYCFICMSTD